MPDAPCRHAMGWFEIPVRDLERAEALYGLASGQPPQRPPVGAATIAQPSTAQVTDGDGPHASRPARA